jgi:hypothetical protein
MKRIMTVGALVALTACTPTEFAKWTEWHNQDPAAAEAFAEEWKAAQHTNLTNNHAARWDQIARCESGGRWDYPLVTNRTGTYSGGLMIWNKAWDAYGGNEFASDAYLATKAQQIEIAERILADQGWGAWDCS